MAFVYLPCVGRQLSLIEEAARSIWGSRVSRRLEVGSATMANSTDLLDRPAVTACGPERADVMPLFAPIQSLVDLLDQMRATVARLDDETYAAPPPQRVSGGIGGHVRHCLDHVTALLAASRSGVCEYDRRLRHTAVEMSRAAAIQRITDLTAILRQVNPRGLDARVLVETQLEPGGPPLLTQSSLCRELAFVISHTIHHNALIAQMLRERGVRTDARYGVAPSTPLDDTAEPGLGTRHTRPQETSSCAR